MKYLLVLFMVLVGAKVMAEPGPGGIIENRAVSVKVLGGFTGFDADGYRAVRAAMASLITEGVVDHFVTTAWGLEGGHVFCVQLNPDPHYTLDRITKMLAAIKPANQTIFEYHDVLSCVGDTSTSE
jgi:hypothetical protein